MTVDESDSNKAIIIIRISSTAFITVTFVIAKLMCRHCHNEPKDKANREPKEDQANITQTQRRLSYDCR